jgi:predicted RNA-binding Zn-ribbon protein involved in translation (DUF1610 family)
MFKCPNCSASLVNENVIENCSSCGAVFGPGSEWSKFDNAQAPVSTISAICALLLRVLKYAFVLLGGAAISLAVLLGLCSLAVLEFSNFCGHNFPMWFPLLLPFGVYISWSLVCRMQGKRQ